MAQNIARRNYTYETLAAGIAPTLEMAQLRLNLDPVVSFTYTFIEADESIN